MKKFLATAILAVALIVGGNAVNTAEAHAFTVNPNYDFVEVMTNCVVATAIVHSNIDFLALRSGPSTSSPMIARIPPGARIELYRELGSGTTNYDRFEMVEYRDMHGYAHSRYFTMIRAYEIP